MERCGMTETIKKKKDVKKRGEREGDKKKTVKYCSLF